MTRNSALATDAVLTVGLLLAGCTRPSSDGATQELPHRAASAAGGYVVHFRPHPDPIPLNAAFSLEVLVTRAAGDEPVGPRVALDVDAAMPEHQHGMNTQPRVTPLGAGRFRVEGMQLHMAGRWELYFDVSEGAATERAAFEVMLE